jgi:hypothetical protein
MEPRQQSERAHERESSMSTATEKMITAERARMRIWRRVGDEREAARCSDRIDDLLDRISAVTLIANCR